MNTLITLIHSSQDLKYIDKDNQCSNHSRKFSRAPMLSISLLPRKPPVILLPLFNFSLLDLSIHTVCILLCLASSAQQNALRFIHICVCVLCIVCFLNFLVALHVLHPTVCPSIHPLMNFEFFQVLTIMNKSAIHISLRLLIEIFNLNCLFLMDKCLGLELLGHKVSASIKIYKVPNYFPTCLYYLKFSAAK